VHKQQYNQYTNNFTKINDKNIDITLDLDVKRPKYFDDRYLREHVCVCVCVCAILFIFQV
jgi:hypothetical protein